MARAGTPIRLLTRRFHHLKPGDVILIPPGTGHWFTEIPDHITYLMVRIDPDKVVPTKGRKESEDDLKAVPTRSF
jgi:cupin superfamily acireductone dioxygenase involved in methionine salvage